MEIIKSIVKRIISLEKQYTLIIFFVLVWILKIFSGGALEYILYSFDDVLTKHIPVMTSAIHILADDEFIYNFTKLLAMLSGLTMIIGWTILTIQLIYDKYSKLGTTEEAFQYTVDLFGGISITSANMYISIWILTNIFYNHKVYLYKANNSIMFAFFIIAAGFSMLMLLALFVNGKRKKKRINKE